MSPERLSSRPKLSPHPDLLNPNLHFSRFPNVYYAHRRLGNTVRCRKGMKVRKGPLFSGASHIPFSKCYHAGDLHLKPPNNTAEEMVFSQPSWWGNWGSQEPINTSRNTWPSPGSRAWWVQSLTSTFHSLVTPFSPKQNKLFTFTSYYIRFPYNCFLCYLWEGKHLHVILREDILKTLRSWLLKCLGQGVRVHICLLFAALCRHLTGAVLWECL